MAGLTTGGQVKKITAGDGDPGDDFGYSVSISGDIVVVVSTEADAVFIFYRDHGGADNWGKVKKIILSGISGYSGSPLCIDGDTLMVGAGGAVYIFYRDQGGIDNWGEFKKITASDGDAEDRFGWSIALSGDSIVVGAYWDDDNGTDSGSVYIFERDHGGTDNWGEVRKIIPTDGAEGDYFGNSVSISLDTVAVGSHRDDDSGYNSGSVYIFERNNGGADTWGQLTKITPSNGAEWAQFGKPTFVSENTIGVGLPQDSVKGCYLGSAFVFERNKGGTDNWGEQKWLFPVDINYVAGDRFGRSVSTDSETIAVSAYLDDESGSSAGAVYIFERDLLGPDNWAQYIKKYFVYDTAAAGDYFGWSVSVDSGTLVVGAYRDDDNGSDSGAAYIYDRDNFGSDGWGYDRVKKLLPSDGAASDYFGYCVAISGDTVIVGSHQNDDNGTSSGSAYIFERNHGGAGNWGQVKKIMPTDGAAYDYFGSALCIDADTLLVGARGDDDNGSNSGSAYIFCRDQGGTDDWG
ncbi:MAG: FG-GAP repeat protein, partial [Thermodesulfobacteriota bacterium]|nr:FG-GAP repeat protein [Thermodesulfobacteriota bacterium]